VSDDRPIYLVGFMGSGKTEVGRRLAARLGWALVDTDVLVEQREGRTIERIFEESGEGCFREAEWRALESLADVRRTVIATGGGLYLGAAQRRFIRRHGVSVWLDVTLEAARARAGGGETRPLWRPEDPPAFRAFFEKRRAAYALADCRVDVSSAGPEALAERISLMFSSLSD
jgi:shikimate kinase